MQSSEATKSEQSKLHTLLAEITEIDAKVAAMNAEIGDLKERRTALEKLACEEMSEQRLDGVRVAGRSWRVEYDHHMSVATDRRDAVLEAARAVGAEETLITVNTSRLKSLLKEMAADAGTDARGRWSDGTPFAGLVSEFVAPKLRHLTVS